MNFFTHTHKPLMKSSKIKFNHTKQFFSLLFGEKPVVNLCIETFNHEKFRCKEGEKHILYMRTDLIPLWQPQRNCVLEFPESVDLFSCFVFFTLSYIVCWFVHRFYIYKIDMPHWMIMGIYAKYLGRMFSHENYTHSTAF